MQLAQTSDSRSAIPIFFSVLQETNGHKKVTITGYQDQRTGVLDQAILGDAPGSSKMNTGPEMPRVMHQLGVERSAESRIKTYLQLILW